MTIKRILFISIFTFSTSSFAYLRAATTVSLECQTKNEGTILSGNIQNSTCPGYDNGKCGPAMLVKNGKAINLSTPNGAMNLSAVQGPDNKWSDGIVHGVLQFAIANPTSFSPDDQFWAILNLDTCQIITASKNVDVKEFIYCSMVIREADDSYYQSNYGPSSAFSGKYSSSKCITAE